MKMIVGWILSGMMLSASTIMVLGIHKFVTEGGPNGVLVAGVGLLLLAFCALGKFVDSCLIDEEEENNGKSKH